MIKLLIANGPEEAALAGRIQARLPSEPPIVFVEHDARPVPKSTGHTYRRPFKESLDLALRVHPDTRHVFVVRGASAPDARNEGQFRSQVPVPPPGVELTFLRLGSDLGSTHYRVDRPAGGAAGALHCLSDHGPVRRRRPVVSDHIGVGASGGGEQRADLHVERNIIRALSAVGGFQANWPPQRRANSRCACCAASDPRTFRSRPST